jgi:competence CoiA-like predicted nuclease|tara:strand:- start:202 stop:414 length:213 start_codon:yes stop_codon:yes gene_type:complete
MATMTSATLNEQIISIEEAIDLRDNSSSRPNFRCPECHQPVRAHKSGGHAAAHFEHLERNANCTLSHVAR